MAKAPRIRFADLPRQKAQIAVRETVKRVISEQKLTQLDIVGVYNSQLSRSVYIYIYDHAQSGLLYYRFSDHGNGRKMDVNHDFSLSQNPTTQHLAEAIVAPLTNHDSFVIGSQNQRPARTQWLINYFQNPKPYEKRDGTWFDENKERLAENVVQNINQAIKFGVLHLRNSDDAQVIHLLGHLNGIRDLITCSEDNKDEVMSNALNDEEKPRRVAKVSFKGMTFNAYVSKHTPNNVRIGNSVVFMDNISHEINVGKMLAIKSCKKSDALAMSDNGRYSVFDISNQPVTN